MADKLNFIKECVHNFFLEAKLSRSEQLYLQELMPSNIGKPLTIEEHIELFNEVASFYTGEFARLIKKYLLMNNLLEKDNARILKEELLLFKNFFDFLLTRTHETQINESTLKRLEYVILKIDKYLKKYSIYLSI